MTYEFIDDGVTSDVTFRARGVTLDELFAAAAEATTQVMVAVLESVRSDVQRAVGVDAPGLDLLLARFLDELIFRKDVEQLLLRPVRVCVHEQPCHVDADLAGERIDPTRHALGADVKAVTLHNLHVERRDGAWHAEVTLDV